MRPARHDLLLAAIVAAVVFLTHAVSPNSQPYDSRWSIHTTLSLIHRGDAHLDEYLPLLEADEFYHIECVFPDGSRIRRLSSASQCEGGHYYHFYPLGVPLLAAPVVAPLELGLTALQPGLGKLGDRFLRTDIHKTFFHGDLIGSSRMVELLVASLLIALSAGFLYLMAREWLPSRSALLLALLYAFGSCAWSTGSRALWMHGFSMLLLVAAFWLLRLAVGGVRAAWPVAGALLVFAFFVRPTNVVPLAAVGIWILWKHRPQALRFAAGALPVGLLFVGMHLSIYQSVLPAYSQVQRAEEAGLSAGPHVPLALVGNLVSPSRGLLVYTPVVIFSVIGLLHWLRRKESRDWAILLGAVFLGHYVLISSYEDWFGGHGYGPRYFADLSPLLVIPLAGLISRPWRLSWGAPLLLCAAISVFMHSQGAWCWPCMEWVTKPVEIRSSQWRLWDWRDPMFLRGIQPAAAELHTLPPAHVTPPSAQETLPSAQETLPRQPQ